MNTIDQKYKPFVTWLCSVVNDKCLDVLTNDSNAIHQWLNDIDVDNDGHIEVASRYTKSGRPETNSFPELLETGPDGHKFI